jgi:hypothetical protein
MTDNQYICSRHSGTLVYKIDPASLTPGPITNTRNTHSRFPCVRLCIWYSASDLTIKRITFFSNNGCRIQFSLNKKKATLLQRWALMESCRFASKWDHTSIRPHKDGRKRKLDRNLFHHTPHKRDLCPEPLNVLLSQVLSKLNTRECHIFLSPRRNTHKWQYHVCVCVCPRVRKFNFPVTIPKPVCRTHLYVSLHICIR